MQALVLDGTSLTLSDLAALRGPVRPRVEVTAKAWPRVEAARKLVEHHVQRGDVVYGLTTGFGKLKSVAIDRGDLKTLQRNLVLSHCCGVGEPMPAAEVRAAMLLRVNGLLRGHSGVRRSVIETILRLYHHGFVPVVPQQGSVGASGDLAPLAHLTAAYLGVGEAWIERGGSLVRMQAAEALAELGEKPLELEAKEGLALINGTEIMKATGSLAWLAAANISKAADCIAALSIEALQGSVRPFDARFAELKGQLGHARCAENVRACLANSQVLESHKDCDRVQDPYSLRCVPQIHGAYKSALAHVGEVLGFELNSVTDNPILFPDTGEVVSAGQFHGQPISMVMDYLALSLCTVSNVSERRIEQLVNPDLSHLPAFLTPKPGLNSGLMIAQVAAASLASENKSLAHPSSVDSIPTSANQEDHVSMGATAARRARTICANVEVVLAIELLCAAQAREFHIQLRAGTGAQAAYEALRQRVSALDRDRYLQPDIEAARQLVASGELVAGVEAALGRALLA